MAHKRQSRPGSDLGLQANVLKIFLRCSVPSSLASGRIWGCGMMKNTCGASPPFIQGSVSRIQGSGVRFEGLWVSSGVRVEVSGFKGLEFKVPGLGLGFGLRGQV